MQQKILMIASIAGAENCAETMASQLGVEVEVASSRRAGLLALRHGVYAVVVVEESLVESDPVWADMLWSQTGLALPVQVNFAIAGVARMTREVKAALARRTEEQSLARRAAAAALENELKSSVTGLMLESELALREPVGSALLEPKLRHLVELAATLRERLRNSAGSLGAG